MIIEKTKVTALADIIGMLPENRPNNNHSKVPNANREYIDKEMPEVSFVRIVLIACGRKETVVQAAATRPVMVTISMCYFL
jgi:hypothetical protein